MSESNNNPVRAVSRFEANILWLLQWIFGRFPAAQAKPLLEAKFATLPCLSANALHLIQDMLAKGTVHFLVRTGGWRKDRFLRHGEPVSGRLWQRSAANDLQLSFGRETVAFMRRLAAEPVNSISAWPRPDAEFTPADSLFFLLAYESLREFADSIPGLSGSPYFSQNALVRLAYPDDFAFANAEPPDFTPWFTGLPSLILEALQPLLRDRWLEIERHKGQISDWEQMHREGGAQIRLLDAFASAAEKARRLDLCRFQIDALSRLLGAEMQAAFWIGGLQGNGPPRLAERVETHRMALSLIQQLPRWRQWEQQARNSGYLDEDYKQSKFFLAEWEHFGGDTVSARGERILQQVEPFRMAAAEA